MYFPISTKIKMIVRKNDTFKTGLSQIWPIKFVLVIE